MSYSEVSGPQNNIMQTTEEQQTWKFFIYMYNILLSN